MSLPPKEREFLPDPISALRPFPGKEGKDTISAIEKGLTSADVRLNLLWQGSLKETSFAARNNFPWFPRLLLLALASDDDDESRARTSG